MYMFCTFSFNLFTFYLFHSEVSINGSSFQEEKLHKEKYRILFNNQLLSLSLR